ncbi:hypothetical protein EYF80_018379 [Liparis tanakae]|uniref:Uncharacterized protein n=1 Tax=Liparis tanakae TaxID=230148 RepID=A0A4Z2I0V6_9TELE|nr:hypothetical protein EYF80_018379 [Liparis tanakae]
MVAVATGRRPLIVASAATLLKVAAHSVLGDRVSSVCSGPFLVGPPPPEATGAGARAPGPNSLSLALLHAKADEEHEDNLSNCNLQGANNNAVLKELIRCGILLSICKGHSTPDVKALISAHWDPHPLVSCSTRLTRSLCGALRPLTCRFALNGGRRGDLRWELEGSILRRPVFGSEQLANDRDVPMRCTAGASIISAALSAKALTSLSGALSLSAMLTAVTHLSGREGIRMHIPNKPSGGQAANIAWRPSFFTGRPVLRFGAGMAAGGGSAADGDRSTLRLLNPVIAPY